MEPAPPATEQFASVASLFEEFADGVYTLGFRILRDRHLAEDLVQETFMKVMKSLDTFRGEGPIAAWLYRIGYRQAIAASRRRRDTPIDPQEALRQSDGVVSGAEERLLASELARRLDEAISRLSEPLRAAFVLRDVEGLTTASVARALDVSQSAVKMRLARAREELRIDLKEYLR